MTTTKRIKPSDEVLSVLIHAETETSLNGEVVLRLTGQLDRKLYEAVNKVLEELGGKWSRKDKGHIFPVGRNPLALLNDLQEGGEIELEKLDFFPTPTAIATRMMVLCGIKTDDIVLEPSAGTGSLCDEMMRVLRDRSQVHFCEINEEMARLLVAKRYKFMAHDFLSFSGLYTRILMNPPFSGQRDIAHVLHAYDCLAQGGRLVAVMAESAFFREDKKSKAFRDFLALYGWDEELPSGAFKESGTMVKARLVVINKPSEDPR